MLFNFEMDSKDRAIVLFTASPQLNNTLRLSANESLRQRITMNYKMNNLSQEDGRIYINARPHSAKSSHNVFDEQAITAILNASSGVCRVIDKICNMCLIMGDTKQIDIINADIVREAVNEIELG